MNWRKEPVGAGATRLHRFHIHHGYPPGRTGQRGFYIETIAKAETSKVPEPTLPEIGSITAASTWGDVDIELNRVLFDS